MANNLGIWLLAAVLVVGIVAVASNGLTGDYLTVQRKATSTGTTAKYTYTYVPKNAPAPASTNGCTDTDGGVNYYQVGTATDSSGNQLRDRCAPGSGAGYGNGTAIVEYFCNPDGSAGSTTYDCATEGKACAQDGGYCR